MNILGRTTTALRATNVRAINMCILALSAGALVGCSANPAQLSSTSPLLPMGYTQSREASAHISMISPAEQDHLYGQLVGPGDASGGALPSAAIVAHLAQRREVLSERWEFSRNNPNVSVTIKQPITATNQWPQPLRPIERPFDFDRWQRGW